MMRVTYQPGSAPLTDSARTLFFVLVGRVTCQTVRHNKSDVTHLSKFSNCQILA